MYCHVVVAPFSINGTKLAAAVTSSSGSAQTCGFAIYNADGSTQLAEIAASCTAAGILTVTGQTINLTAGTEYTICHCRSATNVSNTYLTAMNSATAGMNYGPDFLGAATAHAYEATNTCTTGNPPATTGGSAGATTQGPPILVIE